MKIIPVIHFQNYEQAHANVARAASRGLGVLLIDMEGHHEEAFIEAAWLLKQAFPCTPIGINFLNYAPAVALQKSIELGLDMTWIDACLTRTNAHEHAAARQAECDSLVRIMASHPKHKVFVGVAFKYQMPEPNPGAAAAAALRYGFIPCTSGAATGKGIAEEKLQAIRAKISSEAELAVASGVDAGNAGMLKNYISHALVATSITTLAGTDEMVDLSKLDELLKKVE